MEYVGEVTVTLADGEGRVVWRGKAVGVVTTRDAVEVPSSGPWREYAPGLYRDVVIRFDESTLEEARS